MPPRFEAGARDVVAMLKGTDKDQSIHGPLVEEIRFYSRVSSKPE
jgi:hypothetical protein